ncbi:MAG: site-specific integrase [Prevotellaceae bacterium]|jgi:site-specific recombinase XerD|nr:site-specific integrase [Prevotellaceae bacterium]
MKKVTYSFIFNRRGKKLAQDERAPIHLEVYFSRTTRRWLPTGVEIESRYWDTKAGLPNKKHPNYTGIYQILNNKKNEIEAYELSLINQGGELTPDVLNVFINGTKDSFISFAECFVSDELNAKHISKKTATKYKSNLGIFRNAAGDIRFADINETLINKLDLYFVQQGYEQTTIGKFHAVMKKFIKLAERKGVLDMKKNPYLHYKVNMGQSERVNLEPSELQALESLDRAVMPTNLIEILDRFLYSCWTGIRIGDILLLSKDKIKHTDDGLVVEFITEKGKGTRLVHHLRHLFNGKPEKIVQKYLDLYPDIATVFPKISEQEVNRCLKTLAYMAGIKKTLTFHMARHTCGTALADITANPYLIMDILGHGDIKTSMIYIHRSAERIKRQLQAVTWNW